MRTRGRWTERLVLAFLSALLPAPLTFAHTIEAQGEKFIWDVNGETSGFELNRFENAFESEIHFVTEFKEACRIEVHASWAPSPVIGDTAPYQSDMSIGIPSFDQDEYHSFVATNWVEPSPDLWPTNPGTMSITHNDFFLRNSYSNMCRIAFYGTWMNDPTNIVRSGPTKYVHIYVWSFDDVYGFQDASDAPWVKGFGDWTPFVPSRRKPPWGCGGCQPMGLPTLRVNTALLSPLIEDTDFAYDSLGPDIALKRTYNGDPSDRGIFGNGWDFCYEGTLGYHHYGHSLVLPDGRHAFFSGTHQTNGTYAPWPGVRDELSSTMDSTNGWVLYQFREKETDFIYRYRRGIPVAPSTGYGTEMHLLSVADRNANRVGLAWSTNRLLSVTDAVGRVTAFLYDANGLCTNVVVPSGGSLAYRYDISGNLVETRDLAGNVTLYGYNGNNCVTSMNTEGRTWWFRYTASNSLRLAETVDPLGFTNRFTMGPSQLSNRQVSATDPLGQATWFGTSGGRLTSKTEPLSRTSSYQYDPASGLATNITDPRGFSREIAYDARRNVSHVRLPDGALTTYGYDALDHVTALTNALGGVTTFGYDSRGNPTRITTPAGRVTGMGYDTLGRLTAVTNPAGEVTRFAYDAFGNVRSITDPAGYTRTYGYDPAGIERLAATNERGFATTYEYDANRRPTRIVHPDGTTIEYGYDCCALTTVENENGDTNRIERNALLRKTAFTDGAGGRTDYAYDGNGNLVMAVDAVGRTNRTVFDEANRLKSVNFGYGGTWPYYDANDNIEYFYNAALLISPPGFTVSTYAVYSYDANNRMTNARHSAQLNGTTLQWDLLGRLTNRVNCRGQSIANEYDADGLRIRKTRVGGTDAYGYDAAGRLTNWSGPGGSLAYARDSRGLVTGIQYGDGHGVAFTRDPVGEISAMTYPGGLTVAYQRDSRDRITNMTWAGQSVAFSYDGAGHVVEERRSNGTESDYAYDRAGRMTGVLHEGPADTLIQLAYARNAAGETTNIAKQAGLIPWLPVYEPTATTFQVLHMLGRVNDALCSADADGNLTGISNTPPWSAAYDAQNRLTSLTRDGTNTAYTYDGFGRCVRIVRAGATRNLHWDRRERLLFETDAGGGVTATCVYRENDLVAMNDGSGWHFYHFDKNGNTLAMTDEAGALSAIYRYLPYGATAKGYARVKNPFTHVGRWGVMDEGGGLYYMRNRFYDAGLRRFLTIDPIGFHGGLNLYAYAGGSPADNSDPLGLEVYFGLLMHWLVESCPEIAHAVHREIIGDLADVAVFFKTLETIREVRLAREAMQDCGDSPPPRKPKKTVHTSWPQSFDEALAEDPDIEYIYDVEPLDVESFEEGGFGEDVGGYGGEGEE